MPVSRDRRRGYLLVAVGAVLFTVNAGVSRAIQAAGVESTTLTTVRCTGTAIVLVAVVLGARRAAPAPRRAGGRSSRSSAFGISGVALVQWFYFVAIDRLPVGIALLLEFTGAGAGGVSGCGSS